MAGPNGFAHGIPQTVTALGRWSVANKQLPGKFSCLQSPRECDSQYLAAEKIKALHVYDFDNTRK
jgi:hypothetical protein